MKDIHHTCRCTGQQFTFKEWCAWLDSHGGAGKDSGSFVVLSHNGFDFNIHDVCLTPNVPVQLFNTHCRVKVRTAQSPNGRWDYGLDVIYTRRDTTAERVLSGNRIRVTPQKQPQFLPPCLTFGVQPNTNW